MEDAAVAQFTEITGSSPETAAQYLQLSDYNLETAMQLYFENGGAEIRTETRAPAAPASSSRPRASAGYEDEDGVVHINSDDEGVNIPVGTTSNRATSQGADQSVDRDLEIARRLQEELYGSGDAMDTDTVRAPMARITETLVGPDMEPDDVDSEILRQVRVRQRARAGIPI